MVRSASVALAAALAWSPSLAAQTEPYLGTWEMNLTRSSITRGAPPRGEAVVIAPEPGGFSFTLTVTTERGANVEIHHFIFDGAFHQTEGSDPRELSVRRLDPLTIEQDTRRNGQITVRRRFALSQDGKTMTLVASGVTGGGQPYANDTRVYERK